MLGWTENVAEGWGKNAMGTGWGQRWGSGRSASMPAGLGHVVGGGPAPKRGCPCSIQPSHVPYPQPTAPTVTTRGGEGRPRPPAQTGDVRGQRASRGSAEDRGCSAGLGRGAGRQQGPLLLLLQRAAARAPHRCLPRATHALHLLRPTPLALLGALRAGRDARSRPYPNRPPAAPPAPRAAPHVPCRTTRPHAHACPRTYTPACGAPRAAQTPFASPGCPRLGRHGATALQRLDFIYGPRGEVLPLLRAPTSLPGPGAAAVPPGRSEHRARAAIKALSSPSLSACLCGRGSVPTAWGQPGGGLGSGLNSGRGAAPARGWPRAHTAPSLTHAPPVPARPRTRTAPPSTRMRDRSSSATAPPRGRRARRRGAGRRRR